MAFLQKQRTNISPAEGSSTKKKVIRVALFILALIIIAGVAVGLKTGFALNKITQGDGSIFKSILKSLPGVEKVLEGEKEGRINILLLGMRGENVPGGGLLADTIMVLSIHPKGEGEGDTSKASLISIPRDLYVTVPGGSEQRKINAVFALGEERRHGGGGMEDMRTVVSGVIGQPVPYAVTINFQGFKDVVNALGGIDVTLDQPFTEGLQFREPQVCDPYVFTEPTNPPQFQNKYHTRKDGTKYIAKSYPLCYNKNVECGGEFSLPAGVNRLDGDKALCYSRARYQTNDFERAKRQQQVIQSIKAKALSVGTLTDFSKVNALIDSLGNNTTTNMQAWELKRAFDLYQQLGDVPIKQAVLSDSEEGLLYAPPMTEASGYILLPRGDNYNRIHELFGKSLE
jgi:polyisoprenyl-teichoic acid--peptidoglycan teichoic acid transferase